MCGLFPKSSSAVNYPRCENPCCFPVRFPDARLNALYDSLNVSLLGGRAEFRDNSPHSEQNFRILGRIRQLWLGSRKNPVFFSVLRAQDKRNSECEWKGN
jgi:hypothetical protein